MKVLTFASRKGGSGKSMLAINLAVAFDGCGVNTSIIDLDPQKSAWHWGQDRGQGNFPDVFTPRLDQLSSFMGDLERNDVKLVVIDTPPHSDERTLAGLRLADLVLAPFRPSIFDLRALEDTVQMIGLAGKKNAFLVLNAAPNRSVLGSEALEAASEFGMAVASVSIGERVALAHAITAGKGVTEYEPKGKAADEIIALRRFVAKQLKIRKGM